MLKEREKRLDGELLKKERIGYLDLARTFAVFCVVLCHCVEKTYGGSITKWSNTTIENIFSICLHIIGRLGVPVFLFLTGFLILNKKFDNEKDIKRFYKKNLIPLITVSEIWNIIYIIFYSILKHKIFSFFEILKYMLFLDSMPANMWYMPMIIGIYIALPFVAIIVNKISIKVLAIPFTLATVVCFGTPLLNIVLRLMNNKECCSFIDVNFLGGIYGIYILIGYFISKGILKNFKSINLYIIAIAAFLIIVEIKVIINNAQIYWGVWYDSIFILICGASLFELFTRIKINDKIRKMTQYISQISLGIFFVHVIIIDFQWKYINKLEVTNLCRFFIILIITNIVSVLSVTIISKIKFIKNTVFLIKD